MFMFGEENLDKLSRFLSLFLAKITYLFNLMIDPKDLRQIQDYRKAESMC